MENTITSYAGFRGMGHIELIGPPGVGKSTIHSQLIKSSRLYGGINDNAIPRIISTKKGKYFNTLYKLIPSFLRSRLDEEFIQYRIRHYAFLDFLEQNPKSLKMISDSINSVNYEKSKMLSSFRKNIEAYQIGRSSLRDNEILCLDEGFVLRLFGCTWRSKDSIDYDEFFACFPKPDYLVYVDAPKEIAVERQFKRGNATVQRNWVDQVPYETQKQLKNICKDIVNYLRSTVHVVEIDSTKPVSESVRKVKREVY